jgi:outer membrane PBP1 activator LpoA protein
VQANTTGAPSPDAPLRIAQNDLTEPPPATTEAVPATPMPVPMPTTPSSPAAAPPAKPSQAGQPSQSGQPAAGSGVHIALLLPLRSTSLSTAANAVREGFMSAWQREKAGVAVTVVDTDGTPQNALQRYTEAAAANDIIVGPLARSEVAAIAQAGALPKATVVLAQPEAAGDAEPVLPRNMLAIGLSIEEEARQAARMIGMDKMVQKVLVVSSNIAWQRRAAKAFTAQWRALGLDAQAFDLQTAEGFPTPASLMQLKKKVQGDAPQAMFVALDANLTHQVRLGIGGEVPMWGTSQLNPLTLADWQLSSGVPDLNDTHLLDIPWQLQADHPAVMTYPHPATPPDQRRGADLERLYALGVDAYRVARELASRNTSFDLDGVTGKLYVSFLNGVGHFERVEPMAVYQDGKVVPTGQ